MKKYKVRKCLICGADITGSFPAQKYCDNPKCKRKAHCENVKRYIKSKKNKVKL